MPVLYLRVRVSRMESSIFNAIRNIVYMSSTYELDVKISAFCNFSDVTKLY